MSEQNKNTFIPRNAQKPKEEKSLYIELTVPVMFADSNVSLGRQNQTIHAVDF